MKRAVFISLLILIHTYTLAQTPFSFQSHSIVPGTKSHIKIEVSSDKSSTFIPITIFHGLKSGPVLGITAGIHGYEYPPILAAQQLNQKIDPKELSGTIILVQLANVPAFLGRSAYLNPLDGKNLNRSFPGNPKGTITERIAHKITTEVIAKSDFFVDMHGGDAPEDLRSYNAWYQSEALPEVSKKGKEMALAMGFDYSIIFNIQKERLKTRSIYCSQEAFHRKIPSVDIECGRLGIAGKKETSQIINGMLSLLEHLKMLETNTKLNDVKPRIIAKRSTIKSKSTGLFYTEKKAGDFIKKGELVGYVTDFFGNRLEQIKASENGVILYMIGTPPINKDETLMNIGILP
ncbi:succinylglutamate desuccinylase/aspartoacylase family protein [Aquimarina litoralis]|uniref:succinylglutamate desuccinylase/aspartoacylase family protein n=1 Tax=Aquimarina litoralis TaxID=584605 RepID=UPI001C579CFC|nr:M14 family metallopeptidase [Aquimarina litoralis]MBW1296662.1 succinylglutamate desuccinylase [Aquimarina litoralis]